MTPPLVTAVIPGYNCAKTIGRCIDSILAQTHPSIEIIYVDDGSTDGSPTIVETKYPSQVTIVLKETNCGASHSRNIGIHLARGEYICFPDADDELHRDKLEVQLEQLIESNAKIGFCRGEDPYGNHLGHFKESRFSSSILTEESNIVASTSLLLTTSHARQTLFDERFLRKQDIEFAYRATQNAPYCITTKPLFTKHHSGRVSLSNLESGYKTLIDTFSHRLSRKENALLHGLANLRLGEISLNERQYQRAARHFIIAAYRSPKKCLKRVHHHITRLISNKRNPNGICDPRGFLSLISKHTPSEALRSITQHERSCPTRLTTFVNPGSYKTYAHSTEFRAKLRLFDNIYADGVGLSILSKKYSRISFDLTSLANSLFAHSSTTDIALVGSTDGKLSAACERLTKCYKGVNFIPIHNGYFPDDTIGEIAKKIQRSPARVVVLGLGPFRQEVVATQLKALIPRGYYIITCGGFIDQTADGKSHSYYPAIVNTLNIRFLYRLFREPKRLLTRYTLDYALFYAHLIRTTNPRRPKDSRC